LATSQAIIRVSADTRQAETQLDKIVRILNDVNKRAGDISLRQLNDQVASLNKAMQNFSSSSETAWSIAKGLVSATKAQVEEQRALNDLLRKANGLRSQSTENRATNTYNTTQRRNTYLAEQVELTKKATQATRELEQARSDDARKRLATSAAATSAGVQSAADSAIATRERDQSRSDEARNRLAAAARDQVKTATKSLEIQYNWNQALKQGAAIAADLRKIQADDLATEQKKTAELAKQQKLESTKKAGKQLEGLAIGGAFPLLFGGGLGAVAGGALGGLNTNNPIFSVFTSSIGQMLDKFAAAAQETGKSLRDPITNFQKLADAGLFASKSQETYIKRLIEVGRITEATAVIQGEMVKKIGVGGVNDLSRLGDSSDKLAKAWAELNLQMQAAVAGPLAQLLEWITSVVRIFGAAGRSGSEGKDILGGLTPQQQQAFQREMLQNNARYGTSSKAIEEERKIFDRYRGLSKPQQLARTKDDPAVLQKAADDALAKAERKLALDRQGIQLQRQTQDLELQIADQVYGFRKRAADLERTTLDLRRSIEDEIFKKRQDVARIEADNDRKRAQIAIERTDLLLNAGRITDNRPGGDLANQMLDALRQYFRSKAEGEANLQQKQRNFTIEMEEIRKAAARFQLDVARKVDEIERQGVELNRDIERAKLTTARAIYDLQIQAADYQVARQKEAIAEMTSAAQQLTATAGLTQQLSGGSSSGTYYQGGIGPRGANQYGPHFDIKRSDGGYFPRNALDRYVSVNGRPLSSGVTVPGGEYGAPRSYGGHAGWDYAFGGRAGLTLQNGAKWAGSSRGSYGDATAFMTPDGKVYKIIHGTFQPGAGGAAPNATGALTATPAVPALPASVGQATSALGVKPRGAIDVSKLLAQDKGLTQMLLNAKTTAMELDAILDGLSVEGFKQQLDLAGKSIDAALTAPLDEIVKKQKDQAAYAREYAGLIQQGTNPALAEQIAQIREQVRLQLEKVETIKTLLTDQQKELEGELAKTTNLKEQKDLQEKILAIKERLAELEGKTVPKIKGKGDDAEKGARENDKGKKLNDYINRLRGQVNDTEGMIVSLAGTIEAELGNAMSTAITGVIQGTTTVEEAMSRMFANIGAAFIEMATQMIAKAIVLKILGIAFGGGGGGGGGGGVVQGVDVPISQMPAGMAFAEGGFVTGPTRALIGEAGESEYVIPASKMSSAMANYKAGKRGDSILSDPAGGAADDTSGAAIDINYSVTEINSMRFVTEDQFQAGLHQAAKRGAEGGFNKTMGSLKNSRSQRSRIGLR
jgi:hypothetical protein